MNRSVISCQGVPLASNIAPAAIQRKIRTASQRHLTSPLGLSEQNRRRVILHAHGDPQGFEEKKGTGQKKDDDQRGPMINQNYNPYGGGGNIAPAGGSPLVGEKYQYMGSKPQSSEQGGDPEADERRDQELEEAEKSGSGGSEPPQADGEGTEYNMKDIGEKGQ